MTASVARQIRRIRERHPDRDERVFMKVGSSETVDRKYLRCFGGGESSPFVVDLGQATHLEEALEFFRQGNARGHNAFVRTSEAAKVGRSTAWAYSGGVSPVRREIRAINPAWAVVSFGTNDLNHGNSPRAALWPYTRHLSKLIDHVAAEGVVPIVIGPGPRSDSKVAARWNDVYAVVTRAVAEARQVPYVNLLNATAGQPGLGLVRDGIHGNAYSAPRHGVQPCIFTDEALQYHYNVRNLVTLEALDRTRRAATAEVDLLEESLVPPYEGDGTLEAPITIDRIPFTHAGDTASAGQSNLDRYESCDDDRDMTGPEVVYRIALSEPQRLRILVFSSRDADVDLVLLGAEPSAGTCLMRAGRSIEGVLEPGVHHLVLDTPVGRSGRPRPGAYLLVVMSCEANDPDCQTPIG